MVESAYRIEMKGIQDKMAMQAIRKIIRLGDTDADKLKAICSVIHDYEDDVERAELDAERRAIEADEAALRREKIDEMFEGMAAPLNNLMAAAKTKKDDAK